MLDGKNNFEAPVPSTRFIQHVHPTSALPGLVVEAMQRLGVNNGKASLSLRRILELKKRWS